MKILLINPPRSNHNAILENASETVKPFIHRKLIGPPLGLITIAAALKGTHDVSVLDLKGECDLYQEKVDYLLIVRRWLAEKKPDIVGVTFIASEVNAGLEIFRAAKEFDPLIITIAGGLHVSLCPHHFDSPFVDIACRGQGGKIIQTVVSVIERGESLDSVGGILVRRGNLFRPTPSDTVPCDAAGDDFIMPAREMLRPWLSTYFAAKNEGPATYLFTSLGCPYKCTFCSIWPQFDGTYYQRRVDSIIDELKTLDEYPVVRFADANTIVNADFIDTLFTRIEQEGIKKRFIMDIRTDTAVKYPDLIRKCAKGGLKVVISGFESFRDDELSRYNKASEADTIREAVKIFDDNGIMVRGNYVIPPDYTEKDFDALRKFAGGSTVALAGYTILTPMPGTQFYYDQFDSINDHDLSKYNFFNCVMKTVLPLDKFYKEVSDMWLVRKGSATI
jgi:radical SAM superfamily enzyme YgiQ (UPF0313 family)